VRARLANLRRHATGGIHLFVLSAFAVAQPLYDLLGDTPEFFVVRGSTSLDLVAFTLGLLLGPPLVLIAAEVLAGLVHPRAQEILHLLFVAALTALIALQALIRAGDLGTWLAFALAGAAGAGLAALYATRRGIRTFLTVLAPAPLVFAALFLVNSPLDKLELESKAEAKSLAPIAADTPVVLVVLDEFPASSLMAADGTIDRVRYPSFARLAGDATWFRNAATVHEHTTEAVPAIMTGRDPEPGRLPLLADHPDNLFTFLGGSYRMHVVEPVTQLCPSNLCPRDRQSFADRMSSLYEDLAVVYGHVVLPEGVSERLPSVSETWQDFGKEHSDADEPGSGRRLTVRNDADVDRAVGQELWADQRSQVERYIDSIEPTRDPTLFFVHEMLPHSPWRFLPSGRQYGDALGMDGIADDRWGSDEWLVEQGWQRHLLQVGLVDRLLGQLLDRLEKTGLYDRSLVIVTADHGVSFRAGDRRRGITPTNIGDISNVPLFVKRPGQERGAIVDRHVRTTDIVPTIADVLGQELPYEADGVSLFDPSEDRTTVEVHQRVGESVSASVDEVERLRDETVARKAAIFGSGDRRGLYAYGPDAGLVGRAADDLGRADAGDVRADVDNEPLLADVDLTSALSPAHVTGHLDGSDAQSGLHLAVAVNGKVAGVTQSFRTNGSVTFSAYLPESAFAAGANDVQIYAIVGPGDDPALAPLGGSSAGRFTLAEEDGAEAIVDADGTRLPLVPAAVDGLVEDWFVERDSVRFGGWAGDVEGHAPADRVLVFANGKLVGSGTPRVGRADLGRRYPGLGRSGFVFDLPRDRVGEGSETTPLRFVAIHGDSASELAYARGFPWRDG
jgi:hypothetical protein